eukprot:Nitzschia sp. Nitz4//scaffold183_size43938//13269//14186//NITZ4_007268-RA/size43938-processed-gene-0.14-mRNA-1//-1//CDS//3329539608//6584//frame0
MAEPEWESSDEEEVEDQEDVKALMTEAESDMMENDGTVLYIGHLSNEWEERDLKNFLEQFGNVENIRISRSVKTGKTRGYAFCRMDTAATATIVADTLQGYFVGGRRLVCQVIQPNRQMFFHTDNVISRRKQQLEVDKKNRQQNLANIGKLKEITSRLVRRERKKRAKLADLGIDYDFPGYESNRAEAAEPMVEDEPPTSSKKKRKGSVGSKMEEDDVKTPPKKRSESVGSVDSASKKKRKDSIGSVDSASKKKRKESIGSIDSASKKSRKETTSTPVKESTSTKKVQSEIKKKKSQKKRRVSAP